MPHPVDPQDGASALIERARLLIDVNRARDAVSVLLQAIGTEPSNYRARCELCRAFVELGEHKLALSEIERAAALEPDSEWVHRLRALTLEGLGRKQEAVAAAREAVRLDPQNPRALQTLGRLLLAIGDTYESAGVAAQLLEAAPDWSFSHQLLGLIALRRRWWREAEWRFREALRIDPLSAVDMNNLGVSLERQGRKKEAIERYHDAARLSPTDKRVQRNLKRTLTSYVGGGFALIWLVAQAVRLFSTGLEARGWGLLALLPLLAIVVIVAFWLKRRRRLKELHPTVQAFYAGERTRERKQLPLQIAFLVMFVVALGWTLMVVLSQDIRRSSGPLSWSIYALVLAGAVACTTQLVRRATAERRRLRD